MSQRDFMTAISRLSFQAGTLGARGGQYVALAQLNQLIDHFETLVTYPSADTFSPFTSPIADDGLPYFGAYETPAPAAVQAPCPPRLTRKHTGFYFDAPHTLDSPPPHPSRYDVIRTDRPLRTAYPAANPKEGFNVRRQSDHTAARAAPGEKDVGQAAHGGVPLQ